MSSLDRATPAAATRPAEPPNRSTLANTSVNRDSAEPRIIAALEPASADAAECGGPDPAFGLGEVLSRERPGPGGGAGNSSPNEPAPPSSQRNLRAVVFLNSAVFKGFDGERVVDAIRRARRLNIGFCSTTGTSKPSKYAYSTVSMSR